MKLRQNRLVPLRLHEYVPQNVGDQNRFEEILEALDSIRLDWLHPAAHSSQPPQPPQPHRSPQPPESKPASSDRPISEQGLGSYLANLPQKTLGEYAQARDQSLLSHVFRIAANYQSQTDRVVFLGDAQSQSVIKSILHACCDPYWNHWTRAERGSKPRRFFAGESWDNDTHQAILEYFSDRRAPNRREEFDWGVVRLTAAKGSRDEGRQNEGGAECLDTDPVASFASILKNLHAARHSPTPKLPTNTDEDLWIECLPNGPVGTTSKNDSASRNGVPESKPLIPSALLAFTFCGLLPAAILGVNVMELLAGAHFISKQFFESDKTSNPLLRWTAWQIFAQQKGFARQIYYTNSTLEWGARWLCELHENRSWVLHPPDRYHNNDETLSERGIWQCHFVVDSVRYDTLLAPNGLAPNGLAPNGLAPNGLAPNGLAPNGPGLNYSDKMQRDIQRKLQKLGTSNVYGLVIEFPIVDELAIGQWLQWMILADLLQAELNSNVGKSANSGI